MRKIASSRSVVRRSTPSVSKTLSQWREYMANQAQTATTGQTGQSRQDRQQGQMATSNQSNQVQPRSGNRPQDRELTLFMSPFTLLQRFFSDDMTSLFDDLSGRRTSSQTPARAAADTTTSIAWMP